MWSLKVLMGITYINNIHLSTDNLPDTFHNLLLNNVINITPDKNIPVCSAEITMRVPGIISIQRSHRISTGIPCAEERWFYNCLFPTIEILTQFHLPLQWEFPHNLIAFLPQQESPKSDVHLSSIVGSPKQSYHLSITMGIPIQCYFFITMGILILRRCNLFMELDPQWETSSLYVVNHTCI